MHDFERAGYTVVELLLVVMIAGIVMAIAVPRGLSMLDRIAVQSAAGDVQATLSLARSLALSGNAAVAVDVDSVSGVLRIRRGAERPCSAARPTSRLPAAAR